eukprot:CAMPEP_0182473956 /NCGR_PEP_ID=MMETSP1319-20130603/24814_1 /TAXON_ID=172717 /ORGANISM="Bolidomonas pacifica, Strain RCC208" /LENGTH=99 /DNA_ID=CAMNT_0024674807 /DNA_START=132 /DNA_END=431 /DNA_ORIENTATION=+
MAYATYNTNITDDSAQTVRHRESATGFTDNDSSSFKCVVSASTVLTSEPYTAANCSDIGRHSHENMLSAAYWLNDAPSPRTARRAKKTWPNKRKLVITA